jgi:hypothetical protein
MPETTPPEGAPPSAPEAPGLAVPAGPENSVLSADPRIDPLQRVRRNDGQRQHVTRCGVMPDHNCPPGRICPPRELLEMRVQVTPLSREPYGTERVPKRRQIKQRSCPRCPAACGP